MIVHDPKPTFAVIAGILLAAAYVATGKLGLLLAVAPGYALGIFPPASLALA